MSKKNSRDRRRLGTGNERSSRYRVYKYSREKHARSMVEEGRIRIGTLDYYRKSEDELRGDPHEGAQIAESSVGRPTPGNLLPGHQQRAVHSMMGFRPGPMTVFRQCSFREAQYDPDCYVFCTSRELSRKAAADNDACVEVADINRFAELVAPHLVSFHRDGLWMRCEPVVYGNRTVPHGSDAAQDLVFLKDLVPFGVEKEFRIAWRAREPPRTATGYVDLHVPGIIPLLKLVSLPR